MKPDEMSERLAAWVTNRGWCVTRRVVCLEPDGPRRTWVLTESGRQVGLVRMRYEQCESGHDVWFYEWHVEASDRTREMLGLDT